MRIADLSGKRVCILGFGREGQAALRALEHAAPSAKITIADANPDISHATSALQCGPDYLRDLDAFDIVIKSPGIPPSQELDAVRAAGKLTSGTQLFVAEVEEKGATIVGVTGSKGKSTTTALIAAILQAGGKDAHAVGNIGRPVLDELERIKPNTIFVQEMSSYQLLEMTVSPHIAVVTSFFPEHLDYHGSLDAYREAKTNIVRFQGSDDVAYFNADAHAADIAKEGRGRKIPYSANDAPVTIDETHLIGAHNLSNIAGAYRVATDFGVDHRTAVEAIKAFRGLPHRLQLLKRMHGIDWVDDAISTTPESAIAALHALGERVQTIILGGLDRGNDFRGLAEEIAHHTAIDFVIVFPGSGPRIRKELEASLTHAKRDIVFFEASSMTSAVRFAKSRTDQGRTVLLSTASPSYGMFKNFEQKGDEFQRCIQSEG